MEFKPGDLITPRWEISPRIGSPIWLILSVSNSGTWGSFWNPGAWSFHQKWVVEILDETGAKYLITNFHPTHWKKMEL